MSKNEPPPVREPLGKLLKLLWFLYRHKSTRLEQGMPWVLVVMIGLDVLLRWPMPLSDLLGAVAVTLVGMPFIWLLHFVLGRSRVVPRNPTNGGEEVNPTIKPTTCVAAAGEIDNYVYADEPEWTCCNIDNLKLRAVQLQDAVQELEQFVKRVTPEGAEDEVSAVLQALSALTSTAEAVRTDNSRLRAWARDQRRAADEAKMVLQRYALTPAEALYEAARRDALKATGGKS